MIHKVELAWLGLGPLASDLSAAQAGTAENPLAVLAAAGSLSGY